MDNGLPGDSASKEPSAAMGTPSARGSLASGAGEGAEGWILGLCPPWLCPGALSNGHLPSGSW